jgi:HAD superfamily hydrolase (TIGR01490 family)
MSRRAAFFDMDHTVVRVNTGTVFLSYAYERGRMSKRHVALGAWWAALYRLTLLDTDEAMNKAVATMKGREEQELSAFCRQMFADRLEREITDQARRAIEKHRQRGDVLVLLTASSIYAAQPVADYLGLDHVLATRLQVRDGRLTGQAVEPPCMKEGKVYWAERLARQQDLDLGASAFYTDSHDDIPMLRRVGEPVIVNADLRLARMARKENWRMESWR